MQSIVVEQFATEVRQLQDEICVALEHVDGGAQFAEDPWNRDGGGGGITRIIRGGGVFEQGGVNTSEVWGTLPEVMRARFGVQGTAFHAAGISIVIHPTNPHVPTMHANVRMFAVMDHNGEVTDRWYGGGCDLTPYYLVEDDVVAFHRTLEQTCNRHDPTLYDTFKAECDAYFVNQHRGGEPRGVGGIFFDYLRWDARAFTLDVGKAIVPAYIPIVERRKNTPWTAEQERWQELRRGRYVEFNLLYDRGTLFGLQTNGRTESILMSLPPRARWEYMSAPLPGSEEERLVRALQPRDWLGRGVHA